MRDHEGYPMPPTPDSMPPERVGLEEQKDLYLKKIQESEERLKLLQEKKLQLQQVVEEKVTLKQDLQTSEASRRRRTVLEHLLRGRGHFRKGLYEQALKEWEAVLLLDENHERAKAWIAECENRFAEEARQREIQEEISQRKERERLENVHEARKKYREGRYEEAIEILEKTRVTLGANPEIQSVLSECEARLREIESEMVRARKEQSQHRQEVMRYLNLGRQYARKGEYSRALELYEKCLLLEPDNKIAQEELKRSEVLLRTEEEERLRQDEGVRRLILEKRIIASRAARDGDLQTALFQLEDLLLACPEKYHAELLEQIGGFDQQYREYQKLRNLEENTAQEKQARERRERDQHFLETMFQVETCFLEEKYREALLHLRKLQVDFPERSELAAKIDWAEKRVHEALDQRRVRDLTADEERLRSERLLGDAVSLFYQGRLEASLERLTEVLKTAPYGQSEARDLIRKIELKQNEKREETRRDHDDVLQGILMKYQHALVHENVAKARVILEELRVQSRSHPTAGLPLKEYEMALIQLEQRLKDEKEKNQERFREVFQQGMQCFHLGNFTEAYLRFKEAHSLNPADADAHRFCLQALERQRRSESLIEETRAREEAFALAYETLAHEARIFLQQNQYPKAIEVYEKLLLRFPGHARLKEELKDLEEQYEEFRQEEKSRREEQHYFSRLRVLSRRASRLYFNHHYAEALAVCQEILTLDPAHATTRELRDRILEKKQTDDRKRLEEEKSRETLRLRQQAAQQEKQETVSRELKAVHEAGLKQMREGHYDEAVLEWQKGLILDPAHPVLLEEIQRAKRMLREKEIHALQADEVERRRQAELGRLWREGRLRLLEEQFTEAIHLLDQALDLAGRHAGIEADIQQAEKRYLEQQSRSRSQSEIEIRKQASVTQGLFMGHRYFNNEQYAEAIDAFESVLELDPGNSEAREGILHAEEELRVLVRHPLRGIGRVKEKKSRKGAPGPETGKASGESQGEESVEMTAEVPASRETRKDEPPTPGGKSLPDKNENTAPEGEDYPLLTEWRAQDSQREKQFNGLKHLKKELSTLYDDARTLSREQQNPKAMELLERGLEKADAAGLDSFTVRRMRKLFEHLVRWS